MIKLNNVDKKYDDEILLSKVSYHFKKGRKYFITGPSGCGKSTLLHMIIGIEKIDSGSILIQDKKVIKNYKHIRTNLKNHLSIILQDGGLIEEKTVLDNIKLVSKDTNKINQTLELLGMENKMKFMVYKLSGGEKQKIAIAIQLLKNPDILLIDESTSNIDNKMSIEIINLLLKYFSDKTIVMISHDISLAHYFDERLKIENKALIRSKEF